jgi:hypothetical protein
MFYHKRSWLPLGVDIDGEAISVVAVEATKAGCIVKAAATEAIPRATEAERDLAAANVLRTLHRSLKIDDRRCILGAPSEHIIVRAFRVPPRTRRSEAERAALLEADTIACWPSHDRLIALDPIAGSGGWMMLSIARASAIERVVRLVKLAGLKPVAVDAPLCAWRRIAGGSDALLDLRRDRAGLFLFGNPIGSAELFASGLSDDRLVAQIRATFMQARRDGLCDIQRIAIEGDAARCATIEAQLGADGYEVRALSLGGSDAPTWAFAYALASWAA